MPIIIRCPDLQCGNTQEVACGQAEKSIVCARCGRTLIAAPIERHDRLATTTLSGKRIRALENKRPLPARLGRFEIGDLLSVESFGGVYRAHDSLLDRDVSIRVWYRGGVRSDEQEAWVIGWSKAVALLRHPNIAPVYEAGVDADYGYVVSCLVGGKTLEQVLNQTKPDFRTAARLVMDLAKALNYAHRMGIEHGDLRLARILVNPDGDPVLTDLGATWLNEAEKDLTRDSLELGASVYVPTANSEGLVDQAADLRGLGGVFYELLSGRPPYCGLSGLMSSDPAYQEPTAPRRINRRIPRDLEAVCLKAMSKAPEKRYADCEELAADLRRWRDDQPVHARQPSSLEGYWRWYRQHRSLAVLCCIAVVFLTLILAFMTIGSVHTSRALESEVRLREQAETLKERAQSNLRRAESERRRALAQQNQAEQALQRATAERMQAEQERKRAEAARVAEALQLQVAETERQKAEHVLARATRQEAQADIRQKGVDKLRDLVQDDVHSKRIAAALDSLTILLDRRNTAYQEVFSDQGQFAEIEGSLDTIPLHLRRWEWGYLKRQCKRYQSMKGPGAKNVGINFFHTAEQQYGDMNATIGRMQQLFGVHVPDSVLLGAGGRQDEVFCVVFGQDGRWATATRRGDLWLWVKVARTGTIPTIQGTKLCRITRGVTDLAFCHDNKHIVSADQKGTAQVWDIEQNVRSLKDPQSVQVRGRSSIPILPAVEFTGHAQEVTGVVFTPDEKEVMSISKDGTARLWDVNSGRQLRVFNGQGVPLSAVAVTPDGRTIASGDEAGTIILWNVDTGEDLLTIKAHSDVVNSLAFSPDGQRIISVSRDRTIGAWHVHTGKEVFRVGGHTANMPRLVFSPDGSRFATGSQDGTVKLWDAATGREVLSIRGPYSISCIAFDTVGKYLAATGMVDLHWNPEEPVNRRPSLKDLSSAVMIWEAGEYSLSAEDRSR